MYKKIFWYLLIVSLVCIIIGNVAGVAFFKTVSAIGFCGAGIILLIWVFDRFFLKK